MTGPLVIVGDVLLDRDVNGRAERLCPDSPAPVLEDGREVLRPGGAALAALLAAEAGADPILVAPLGSDPASAAVRSLLPASVSVLPLPLAGALTEKTRFRVDGRTALRVDRPGGRPGGAGQEALAAIESAGAVLVSDYGNGAAELPALRDALRRRGAKRPLVWDPHPHGSAPTRGTWVATPNAAEAARWARPRAAARRSPRQPHSAEAAAPVLTAAASAERLLVAWPAAAVAVTLGGQGALLARREQAPLAVPATPLPVRDACGAGDAFAVATVMALAQGQTMSEAVTTAVASAGGYLAAGGVDGLHGRGEAPAPSHDAFATAEAVRARGGVVAAAGGCFDVVHAGHVAMLRAARSLGDCLVVCLNSDASVRRLKGPGRPLNSAADRVAVLTALDCVDAVAVFDEPTPERLLARLRPHVWVKGGDYDGQELPEAAALRTWNGRVVTVPYLSGRSTTRLAHAAAQAHQAQGAHQAEGAHETEDARSGGLEARAAQDRSPRRRSPDRALRDVALQEGPAWGGPGAARGT